MVPLRPGSLLLAGPQCAVLPSVVERGHGEEDRQRAGAAADNQSSPGRKVARPAERGVAENVQEGESGERCAAGTVRPAWQLPHL